MRTSFFIIPVVIACVQFAVRPVVAQSVSPTVSPTVSQPSRTVSPVIAVPGVTPMIDTVTDFSLGIFDPRKPTFVITHGWNPLPNQYRLTTPQAYAVKMRRRLGETANVLAFHWDSRGKRTPKGNSDNALRAGQVLGRGLLEHGVIPEQVTLIGHSMGTVVVSSTANLLYTTTGRRIKNLVLIDGPKWKLPLVIGLRANECAVRVTNVWADGLGGVGAPIAIPGFTNIRAPIRTPGRSRYPWPDPAGLNHVDVVLWFYDRFL